MTYLDEATHIRPAIVGVETCDLCPELAIGGAVDHLGLHLWLCRGHLDRDEAGAS